MSADIAGKLPLDGLRLIEASAGTGKTWTIAALYLRFIVERKLGVHEILVVTYTRAAADELKDRLRRRIAECAEIAVRMLDPASTTPDPPQGAEAEFARSLIAASHAGGEAPRELARRLRIAALSLDEAAIHTIHAFCQRVLREQAFTAAEPLQPGELVGSDSDLLEQIAADFWRRCASDANRADDVGILAARVGSPEKLGKLLQGILDPQLDVRPAAPSAAASSGSDIKEANRACTEAATRLIEAWQRHGEGEAAAVIARADDLNQSTYKTAKLEAWYAECRECLALGVAPEVETLQRIGGERLRGSMKKGRPPLPDLAFAAAVDDWLAAAAGLEAATAARWPALLAEARAYAREQLARRKQRAGRVSYDDLILRVADAIADPEHGETLAAALQARWPVALVDEFQDTDTRQFEIFRRVHVGRPGSALILVGDPKQAIYRFRGGDVEAYLAAAEQAQTTARLARNFRSSPGLLAAIQAAYKPAAEHAFVDPRIRFQPVEPGGRVADEDVEVDGSALVPMTIWHLPDDAERGRKEDALDLLAAGAAEAIVDLLGKARTGAARIRDRDSGVYRPLAAHDLAVLVSTNAEAGVMQAALAARGVASATIRQASVFASEEARDLAALLGALESRDEARLRAALATRLLGFDAAALAALAEPEAWSRELARLDALDRVWRERGVLALCLRVLETRAAGLLGGSDGERRMTNYLQLAELLQEAAAHTFGSEGLLEWLRRRIARADTRNEEEQLRLESDGDRVRIATVHASKGLEYGLVFLPFTALRPGKGGQPPETLSWHEGGRRVVAVHAIGQKMDAAAVAAAEQEELAERMRVLYVALTRARHACWLSWDVVGKSGALPALAQLWHDGAMPENAQQARATIENIAASSSRIRVAELPTPRRSRLDAADAPDLPSARRFGGRIDSGWWVHSFSQWRDGERLALADEAGADDEAGVEPIEAGSVDASVVEVIDWPRGERFGTLLHEALEHADFGAWRGHAARRPPPGEQARLAALLQRHALVPREREAELLDVVTKMCALTLNTRLPEGLALAELAPTRRRAELPFHFAIGEAKPEALIALLQQHGYQRRRSGFARVQGRISGLMNGIIDLVYRHAGRWWIVDYKTNWLGPRQADYAGDALADAIESHDYDLQYLIYTLALHRWLRARLGNAYDYERDIGGAVYLFVRGLRLDSSAGVFVQRPPLVLIEALDAMLAPERGA